MMPGMDGGATFLSLNELKPGVKVILMSGHSEKETQKISPHSNWQVSSRNRSISPRFRRPSPRAGDQPALHDPIFSGIFGVWTGVDPTRGRRPRPLHCVGDHTAHIDVKIGRIGFMPGRK